MMILPMLLAQTLPAAALVQGIALPPPGREEAQAMAAITDPACGTGCTS